MTRRPHRPRPPRARRRVVAGGAALVLALAVMACGGDDTPAAEGPAPTPETTTEPETTTTSTPTTSTTTEPETTTTTAPPAPVSVLVVGDSVGYTLGEYAPAEIPSVTGVESRALPGCGLLTSGERPPEAVALGVPPLYDDCAGPIGDADGAGLATGPDVVLLVVGAWERADHERDGRTVGPGDDGWTTGVRDDLRARVETLGAGGARVALWVDPCGPDEDDRSRQAWFRDEVIAPVAAETEAAGTFVVDPAEAVCDGDAPRTVEGIGDPRPDDGQHWSPEGAAWLWTAWLGATLAAGAA